MKIKVVIMLHSFIRSFYTLVLIAACLELNAQIESVPSIQMQANKSAVPEWVQLMFEDHPNIRSVDSAYHSYYRSHVYEKNSFTQYCKKWRRAVDPFVQQDGFIAVPDMESIKSTENLYLAQREQYNVSESVSPWNCIGPVETWSINPGQIPVSWQANIYSIAIAPSDPSIMYAGGEAGGVFITTDGGLTWNFASGNSTITSVQSLAVDDFDPYHVLAGTGSRIYETFDGGDTWDIIFELQGMGVNDLAFIPGSSDQYFAATRKGLYHFQESGQLPVKVIDQICYDLEFKPDNSEVIYLLAGNETERRCRFYRSDDRGISFRYSETGWYFSDHPDRSDDGARMTVTPANPDRIYAVLIGNSKPGDNGFIGVYRSDNAGLSWSLPQGQVGGPYSDQHPNLMTLNNNNPLYQGYYNLSIAASHEDPDALLIGGLNLWRSMDGAVTYEALGGYQGSVSWIHPDQQEIIAYGNSMWLANDGGINLSTDMFNTHTARNYGLTGSEFWGLGMGWNEDIIVGGRYHNGNTAIHENYPNGASLRLGGAEAPTGYVNPGSQIAHFSDISSARIPDQLDGVVEYLPKLSLYPNESYFPAHSGEIEFHPRYFNTLILGRENKLWLSKDGGKQFELLKEFGSDSDNPIMQIEISRPNGKNIYVYQRTSFYGATLWKSTDGGISWKALIIPDAESQRAGSISLDPLDPDVLVLAYGHRPNDGTKIFVTKDGGETWQNLSTSLLDGQTVHSVYLQPGSGNTVYIGTNFTVYYRADSDQEWLPFWDGLPTRVRVNKFMPFYKEHKLRLATYGHGIWETDLVGKPTFQAQLMTSVRSVDCIRDTVYFDDYSIRSGKVDFEWSFPGASFVSDTKVRNPKVVYNTPGIYSSKLEIRTASEVLLDEVDQIIEISDACSVDQIPGYAASFQEEGDYASISGFNLESNTFTVTAWVYPYGIQPDYSPIIMNDDQAAGLNFVGGDNSLGYHWPGGAWWWNSQLKVPPYEWSYVGMVVYPDSIIVYLNGVPSKHEISLDKASLNNLRIASYQGWSGRYFKGMVDELAIWDRSLSTQEIRELRHLTKNASRDSGIIGYYQFNESSGGAALDKIGTRHASLYHNASRLQSYSPVGNGVSKYLPTFNTLSAQFAQTGIIWEKKNEDSDTGSWTITRLDRAPINLPPKALFGNHFWLVNYYGANTFQTPERLVIDSVGLIYKGESEETWRWNLWQRSIHPVPGDEWNSQGIADEVDPGGNGSVSYNTPTGIFKDCQLTLTRDTSGLTGSIDNRGDSMPSIYPNPVRQGRSLNIESIDGPFIARVIDLNGKEWIVVENSNVVQVNIPVGWYALVIETSRKLISLSLLVVD